MHEPLSLAMAHHVSEMYHGDMMLWHYEHGLVIGACLMADPGLFQWAYDLYDPIIAQDGAIATYHEHDYNLDQINPGRNLFTLYERTGQKRFMLAAGRLRDQLSRQPRTMSKLFWHKAIYPWQVWLDGLYMEGPFYARYCNLTGDEKGLDDVAGQLAKVFELFRDPVTGLLYHAYDESRGMRWSDERTGLSPHFWGRAMGWYCMAVLDVLDSLPQDHPKRESLKDILRSLVTAILKVQDPESGMWFQILDQGGREGNYLETSATSMFIYTLLKSIRTGITTEGKDEASKAFESMKVRYLDEGLHLGGICAVAGLGGNPYRDGSFAYYVGERVAVDDFKGVGPFILACLEMEKAFPQCPKTT